MFPCVRLSWVAVSFAQAAGVRRLFQLIKELRSTNGDDNDDEGEEESDLEHEKDACVSENGEHMQEESEEEEEKEQESPAVASESAAPAKKVDIGAGVGLSDEEGEPEKDSQLPHPLQRCRSKTSLASLPSSAVLGGASKEALETPASYAGPGILTTNKEDELADLMNQISLYEDGEQKDAATAHHDAMLLLMGSPERRAKEPTGLSEFSSNILAHAEKS